LENKYFQNHTYFTYLIERTLLERALWGENTFPTRNRLLNLDSIIANWPYPGFWVFS